MESEILNEQSDNDGQPEELESSDESGEESFYEGDIPQGLDNSYKNMQKQFTKKMTTLSEERRRMENETERLKQKADMYDKLAADPDQAIEILSRMSGKSGKSRAVDQDEDEDNFDDFGENKETMSRLVNSITRKVTKSMVKEMSPLLQSSQEGVFIREMSNLSTWVKSQREKTGLNLPDPEVLELTIRDRMSKKGDTAIEAYKASINLDRLPARKSVTSDQKKKAGTFQPGGTSKGLPKKLGLTTDDAIERRKQGKKGGLSIEELSEMYDKGELS